jgi:Cft2 family RNA processing exonuclease
MIRIVARDGGCYLRCGKQSGQDSEQARAVRFHGSDAVLSIPNTTAGWKLWPSRSSGRKLSCDHTAHANREDLLDFVGEVDPRVVILTHGDDAARKWMEQQIHARHPKIKVIHPQPGKPIEA